MDYSTLKTVVRRNIPNTLTATEPHRYAAVDAEHRLRRAKVLLSRTDQRTYEIYVAHRGGWTYSEIAAKWGIYNRTIKRCVARALLAIMEHGQQAHDNESN